jgi:hypothetical protein
MNLFNTITTAIFDPILGFMGPWQETLDLWLWPILGGVVALIIYKYLSNQTGIERAKNGIKVHLLEIRLYKDDLLGVVVSTVKIILKNFIYVGHNIWPMLVMFAPMMAMLFQLEAEYAFKPMEVGQVELVKVQLDEEHAQVETTDVEWSLPEGLELDAPPVRTSDGQIIFRVKAVAAGDHTMWLQVGDEQVSKGIFVGGEERKVPVMRTKGWEGYLYPGEAPLEEDSQVYSIKTKYPERSLTAVPDGELGIVFWFFGLSLVAGFGLKGVFGVTL